jgi:hypothetical protein
VVGFTTRGKVPGNTCEKRMRNNNNNNNTAAATTTKTTITVHRVHGS